MVKPLALTNPVVVSYMSYSVIENIIDVNRYSLSKKLLRVTAIHLRFVDNCKRDMEKRNKHLNSNELAFAKRICIQCIQKNVMSEVTFNKVR